MSRKYLLAAGVPAGVLVSGYVSQCGYSEFAAGILFATILFLMIVTYPWER